MGIIRVARFRPVDLEKMKTRIIAVGRARPGPESDLFTHYAGRVRPAIILTEVEEKRPLPPPQLKKREAELLLAAVPGNTFIVALDCLGRKFSSQALAKKIGALRDDGVRQMAFIIGGAEGLDDMVSERSDLILSLGSMTWPHMMVRGMIAEQIYRVQCILNGHPYHRG